MYNHAREQGHSAVNSCGGSKTISDTATGGRERPANMSLWRALPSTSGFTQPRRIGRRRCLQDAINTTVDREHLPGHRGWLCARCSCDGIDLRTLSSGPARGSYWLDITKKRKKLGQVAQCSPGGELCDLLVLSLLLEHGQVSSEAWLHGKGRPFWGTLGDELVTQTGHQAHYENRPPFDKTRGLLD